MIWFWSNDYSSGLLNMLNGKRHTGCSLDIMFFEDFKLYSGLWPLSVSVCVHYGRSNTSAAAELAEVRKITTFYGKTQYLMNTL